MYGGGTGRKNVKERYLTFNLVAKSFMGLHRPVARTPSNVGYGILTKLFIHEYKGFRLTTNSLPLVSALKLQTRRDD